MSTMRSPKENRNAHAHIVDRTEGHNEIYHRKCSVMDFEEIHDRISITIAWRRRCPEGADRIALDESLAGANSSSTTASSPGDIAGLSQTNIQRPARTSRTCCCAEYFISRICKYISHHIRRSDDHSSSNEHQERGNDNDGPYISRLPLSGDDVDEQEVGHDAYHSTNSRSCLTDDDFEQVIQALTHQSNDLKSIRVHCDLDDGYSTEEILFARQHLQRTLSVYMTRILTMLLTNAPYLDEFHWTWLDLILTDEMDRAPHGPMMHQILCDFFDAPRVNRHASLRRVTLELDSIPTTLLETLAQLPDLDKLTLGCSDQQVSLVPILRSHSLKALQIRDLCTMQEEYPRRIESEEEFNIRVSFQRSNIQAVQWILQALTSPSLPTGEEAPSSPTSQLAPNLRTLCIPFYELLVANVILMICSSPCHNRLAHLEFCGHNEWLLSNTFYSDIANALAASLRLNSTLQTLIMPPFRVGASLEDEFSNDRRRRTKAVRPTYPVQRALIRTLRDRNMTLQQFVWPGWTVDYWSDDESDDDDESDSPRNLAELQYYLDLNRMGRKRIFDVTGNAETGKAMDRENHNDWFELLIKAGSNLNCIYYVIRLNPSLCRIK